MHKLQNGKGLVLISVLIFVNLIILLTTIGFTISELQLRMSNNQLQHAQLIQAAQFGLKSARKLLQQHPLSCQIEVRSTDDLSTESAAWWHSPQTCHGKFGKQNYYYVVEPLQINNCLYFDGSSAVKYWRITVRAEQAIKSGAVAILQGTVALPAKKTGTCPTTRYKLSSYQQSWRQLR